MKYTRENVFLKLWTWWSCSGYYYSTVHIGESWKTLLDSMIMNFLIRWINCLWKPTMHCVQNIMVGFREAPFPNIQKASLWILYVYSPKQFHEQLSARRHTTTFLKACYEVLSATFPERWIGSWGSILWPPKSPDLTLDTVSFLCWKHLKETQILPRISWLNLRISDRTLSTPKWLRMTVMNKTLIRA
jgi:hypothetical protein